MISLDLYKVTFKRSKPIKISIDDFEKRGKIDEIIWEINVPDRELAMGMIAAGYGILEILNYEHRPTKYALTSTVDNSEFLLEREIDEINMQSHMKGRLLNNEYGIWVASEERFRYNLFRFTSPKFFQGIISVCDHFGIDFRTVIYGVIFDKDGNQYVLEDYLMADSLLAIDVPDIDEDDVPDIYSSFEEKEREGDENIINPYEIDDIM